MLRRGANTRNVSFETLNGNQTTCYTLSPTQLHSFFRNFPPLSTKIQLVLHRKKLKFLCFLSETEKRSPRKKTTKPRNNDSLILCNSHEMFWFIRALKSEMGFRLSHLPIGQVLVETYLMRPPPKFRKFKIFVNFSPRNI